MRPMPSTRRPFEVLCVAKDSPGCWPFTGTKLEWIPAAMGHLENLGSPMNIINIMSENALDVTKSSERLVNESFKALLAPMPMPSLMDEDDAKDCLAFVKEKVLTRAAKRKADQAAAAERLERLQLAAGEARAAKRAAIAARPVPKHRMVDHSGRVSMW